MNITIIDFNIQENMKKRFLIILLFKLVFISFIMAQSSLENRAVDNALFGQVQVNNLAGINSMDLDYSPVVLEDGIIFTSTRGDGNSSSFGSWFNKKYADLFFAKRNEDGSYQNPTPLNGNVNSKYHDGIATMNPEGTKMYFSRNTKKPSIFSKKSIPLKIYTAVGQGQNWSNAKEALIDQKGHSTCHPTLSADGKKMYFASDRKGGFGGLDIYVTTLENNKWSEPRNLGAQVNTSGNEIFPFVDEMGMLYFSSNGHQGMGGLDIFLAEGNEQKWTVRNIGKPFNSASDDFSFVIQANTSTGFFSSNRIGGHGGDDIYQWELLPAQPEVLSLSDLNTQVQKTYYGDKTIQVRDAMSSQLMPNTQVILSEANKPGKVLRYTTDKNGELTFEWDSSSKYFIEVEKEGYVIYSKIMGTEEMSQSDYLLIDMNRSGAYAQISKPSPQATPKVNEVNKKRTPLPVVPPKEEIVQKESTVLEEEIDQYFLKEEKQVFTEGQLIQLDNIYYDFNKYHLVPSAQNELEKVVSLLQQYPDMRIELNAHTDSKGKVTYNQWLSEQRAKSAVDFIVSKGIAANRVMAKGFGESQLLNDCRDNVNCSDTDHRMNRRTEFRINRVGEKLSQHQSSPSSIKTSSSGSNSSNGKKMFMMETIYYDLGQAGLKVGAKDQLTIVAEMMQKNKGMKIRVVSHTDAVGSAQSNMKLSEKRAKMAADFIIAKGIESSRVQFQGFGESQILNHCIDDVECLEAENRENRRTVIQILDPGGTEFTNLNEK